MGNEDNSKGTFIIIDMILLLYFNGSSIPKIYMNYKDYGFLKSFGCYVIYTICFIVLACFLLGIALEILKKIKCDNSVLCLSCAAIDVLLFVVYLFTPAYNMLVFILLLVLQIATVVCESFSSTENSEYNGESRKSNDFEYRYNRSEIDEYCSILGIDRSVVHDKDVLKAMYRARLKKAHPDSGGSEELCKKINEAYDYLNSL